MSALSPQPGQPATFRLAFAPDPLSAREAAMAVRDFLGAQGVPEKELFFFELCIAEAGNNAIEYAESSAKELALVVEALCTPDQIELRMTDHTAGFVLPARIALPSPQNDRGRGLFIIQSVMDEVRYLNDREGNVLIMRKRRRANQPPIAARECVTTSALSLDESQRQLSESTSAQASMAGELSFRAETLSAIFRCCAELGRSDAFAEDFGKRLLVDLFHLTAADWCILRLISPDRQRLEVVAASTSELDSAPLELPAAGVFPCGIERNVATSHMAARFDLRELSDSAEPLRAIGPEATGLVCPLVYGGSLIGTIAVGRRGGDFPLGKLQDEVVHVFAELLAIQAANLRHHRDEVSNCLIAHELEIAREIQLSRQPHALPQLAGFGLAGSWQSAREVGGDFYDALAFDGRSLFLMIADVMGKGVPAAMFAATMRGLLRGLAARSDDPAEILSGLNRLLCADLSAVNMFITAQVVHLDLETRELTVASAGHCPLLYVPPGGRNFLALASQGLPIGVLPNTAYRSVTAFLGEPATLLLHTDGLTDTCNAAGEMFGQERVLGWLDTNAFDGHSAPVLRDRLAGELNRFRGNTPMTDDQSFLLLNEARSRPLRSGESGARRLRVQPNPLHVLEPILS